MNKCKQNGRVCVRIPSDGKCMSCNGDKFLSARDYLDSTIGKRNANNQLLYDKMLKRRDPEDYKKMIKEIES